MFNNILEWTGTETDPVVTTGPQRSTQDTVPVEEGTDIIVILMLVLKVGGFEFDFRSKKKRPCS